MYKANIANTVPKGWQQRIDEMMREIREYEATRGQKPLQIKEICLKYGFLRVDTPTSSSQIIDIIENAKEDTKYICQQCGDPGERRIVLGQKLTLCSHCK